MDTSNNTPAIGFAERVTELKKARGLSYRQLRQAAGVDHTYLSRLAKGEATRPSEQIARAIGRALGAEDELVELARREHAPPLSGRLQPLGEDDAAAARATLTHLVGLDTLQGSDGLTPLAIRSFRAAADRLAVVGGTADARSAIADLGAAAAWVTADAVERDTSRAIALEALAQAEMAGDTRMRRFLISHLSMVSEHAGRYGDALGWADRALADNPLDPRVRAMFSIRRARALSGLGAASEAINEWDLAEHLLTETPSSDDGLTYWIHDAEMAIHKAVILTRAGDRDAVDWARRGVAWLPGGQGRDQVLFRAMLLSDAVAAHAWKDVPALAEDLMRHASAGRTARVPELLEKVWRSVSTRRVPGPARDAVRAARDAFAAYPN